jgi:hypothetical protein
LHAKYASEGTTSQHQGTQTGTSQQIAISGKVVEEVGFDKIRKQLAQVHALKIVILDGMRIVSVRDEATDGPKGVGETCPSIVELDLGRNLFTGMEVAVGAAKELKGLRSLRLKYALLFIFSSHVIFLPYQLGFIQLGIANCVSCLQRKPIPEHPSGPVP